MNGALKKGEVAASVEAPAPALAYSQGCHQDRRLFKPQINTSIGYAAQQIILSVFVQTKIQI
jgi:hypothetical protein